MYRFGTLENIDGYVKQTEVIVEATSSERYKDIDPDVQSVMLLESGEYKSQGVVNPLIGPIGKKSDYVKTIPLANESGSGFDEDVHDIAMKNHEDKIKETFKTIFFEPFKGVEDIHDGTKVRFKTSNEPMKKMPIGW